jgi:hypothetical protein
MHDPGNSGSPSYVVAKLERVSAVTGDRSGSRWITDRSSSLRSRGTIDDKRSAAPRPSSSADQWTVEIEISGRMQA